MTGNEGRYENEDTHAYNEIYEDKYGKAGRFG